MQAFFRACFTSTTQQPQFEFKQNDPHPSLINRGIHRSQTMVNSEEIEVIPNKFTVRGAYKKKGYSIDYTQHGLTQQKYQAFIKKKRSNIQSWNDNFNETSKA